jgi:hypothetical protein
MPFNLPRNIATLLREKMIAAAVRNAAAIG